MAKATTKDLLARIENQKADLLAMNQRIIEKEAKLDAEREAHAATKTGLQQCRESIADLKARLHKEETARLRLEGYLDRVREDDDVRDGLIEVVENGITRRASKRPPPLRVADPRHDPDFNEIQHNYGDPRRRDWTTF